MLKRKIPLFLLPTMFFSTSFCYADVENPVRHPFYFGAIGGYGSTTWQGLVPSKENQNDALMLSTPIRVEEGGGVWGALAGFEFTHYFALEANYMRYAESNIHFDSMSLFTFFHDGLEVLTSQTESISFMAKLMVPIPHSQVRIFSGTGIGGVYRKDIIINNWRLGPAFSMGLNYGFTEHLMGEIAGNFIAGYGESQLNPVDSYFPFLYSVAAHLIYRF